MKSAWTLCAILCLSAGLAAQTGTAAKTTKKKAAAATAADVQELKDAIAAQQQQIRQLQEELRQRDQAVQQAKTAATDAQGKATEAAGKAEAAQAAATQQQQSVTELKSDVSDLKSNLASTVTTVQDAQKGIKAATESPTALHYKGITLTPGGFVAAETVSRQRATSSDINTPFNSIPYEGNALAHITENSFTARQSRLSLLAEGNLGATKISGYWEGDFLGTGVTSNNRQSNSYVFRQRILFAQAALSSGWTVTGGQQWSLVTETKTGITNRTEVLPQTIDSQYQVGFSWERQYGLRVVKNFNNKFALGIAVEGPQATIGGRGFSTVTTTDLTKGTVSTAGNAFIDGPGSGGGLYNFVDAAGYSFNKTPDFIIKAAADPGWGHYEVFGILSTFRNRVYPCGVVGTNATDTAPPAATTTIACPINSSTSPSAIGAYNDTRVGGGFGANIRVPVVAKKLDFAIQGAGGDGVGRYGSAQLADITLRPDGTQALIRTAHALGEFELHATPKLDIYAYFGGEYGWRAGYQGYDTITVTKTAAIPANGTNSAIPATVATAFKTNQYGGYGSPFANNSGCSTENPPSNSTGASFAGTPSSGGTCAGDTRLISEATLGFWHRITQGPHGGLRWGIQYSYFTRSGWSGNNGGASAFGISPKAVDNMVWTSFRYYLP